MKREIKVGMLVSYDYEYIKTSLPLVYEHADKIVLSVDKDNLTWAGNTFHISDEFWQWVKNFDTQNKIDIHEDSFYVPELTTMQCETRQRNLLAKYMGDGGWHLQIDADEYFMDFKHFVEFLSYLDTKKRHINTIIIEWATLFKKTANGFIFIKGGTGKVPIATTKPQYSTARKTRRPRPRSILYPQRVIHDSWARTEEELWTKLNNWGHNNDFNTEGYFNYWKAINEKNYMFAKNVHPIISDKWNHLDYIEASDINNLMLKFKDERNSLIKTTKLNLKNTLLAVIKLCTPPIFFNRRLQRLILREFKL